jgi:hypothetical protein
MTDEEYARFLAALETPDRAALADKPGPQGPPFKL